MGRRGGAGRGGRTWEAVAFGTRVRAGSAAGLSVAALLISVQVGLGVAGWEQLGPLPGAAALDYTHRASQVVEPLSDEYLARALGLALPEPDVGVSAPAGGGAGRGGAPVAPPGREGPAVAVVEHAPTNDDRAAAYAIERVPFVARTDASAASREPGEPDECTTVERTVWYRYTPSHEHWLTAQAVATGQGASVGVFREDANGLERVGCGGSLLNPAAQVTFLAARETSYLFQVGTSSSGRIMTFTLDAQGSTERVSVAMDGGDPDSVSVWQELSADGRYVVFESWASNLVPDDTNESVDVFVLDRRTQRVERVSVSSTGEQGNGNSGDVGSSISADGRYVAFHSYATNLVSNDTNSWTDVFVHDRVTGTTERVSLASDGSQGGPPLLPDGYLVREKLCKEIGDHEPTNQFEDPFARGNTAVNHSIQCTGYQQTGITPDGRYVVFETTLEGLGNDPLTPANATRHWYATRTYVHDRSTGTTHLVTVGPDGQPMDTGYWPAISDDGRRVVFAGTYEWARGQNTTRRVYVRDLSAGRTREVSVSSSGEPADGDSGEPDISADGRFVTFWSSATNLVDPDTNGVVVDVFVHDLVTGETSLVSRTSGGDQGELDSNYPALSGDGRYVVFHSQAALATGLAESYKVFVHDRVTGATTLASVTSSGEPANDSSGYAVISDDGRHVAFGSWASNLAENDRNGGVVDVYEADHAYQLYGRDIFVHTFGAAR